MGVIHVCNGLLCELAACRCVLQAVVEVRGIFEFDGEAERVGAREEAFGEEGGVVEAGCCCGGVVEGGKEKGGGDWAWWWLNGGE